MAKVEKVKRKSMVITPSGRSTDYISPSFGHGCLFNCTYCYMKRHKPEGLTIATNTEEILTAIDHHAWFADVEKPNQTHPQLITYDISCNEDFALHLKHHEWKKIFDFFRTHERAMGSFATKHVNEELLSYNPEGKIRIRFSLMPPRMAFILEPETSDIASRIQAVNEFIQAGYDVHLNFSPVVVTPGWLEEYEVLFDACDAMIQDEYKDKVKAEVIFLTHNYNKHFRNLEENLPGESLLWNPDIQEEKTSQYGGLNLRYKHELKSEYIKQWTELHDKMIPWNTIRYIF